MKITVILAFLIIFLLLTCGCITSNSLGNQNPDDGLYIKNLEEFASKMNQTSSTEPQKTSTLYSQTQVKAADGKILSITYYNRIEPLKVSSKFELSKNSFLQSLKELETISDLMLNSPTDYYPSSNEDYKLLSTHSQKWIIFLKKTFDSNVCTEMSEKNSNITMMCQELQKV